MYIVEILVTLLPGIALLPALLLFVQVAAASAKGRSAPRSDEMRPTIAVLIPAHNEAPILPLALASIMPQLETGDRLLVIADNCTDETAAVAAAAGAEVLERIDPERHGKGYALDFGIRSLERSPPGVVVVIDADCVAEEGSIGRLAKQCAATGRPVQAMYLMDASEDASPASRIGELAWIVRNVVRPLGCHKLGMPCQLMGSGMGVPWRQIADAPLASGNIVEDLLLGIELARRGSPPGFCPEARVRSQFPLGRRARMEQRRRWEQGHLGLVCSQVPRLTVEAIGKRDLALMALVLDLSVLPLALFGMTLTGLFAAALAFWFLTGAALPVWLAGSALTALLCAVVWAWAVFGRDTVSMAALAAAPLYALAKIPLYLSLGFGKRTGWVRSRREGEHESKGAR